MTPISFWRQEMQTSSHHLQLSAEDARFLGEHSALEAMLTDDVAAASAAVVRTVRIVGPHRTRLPLP
jgi:hypothetical protein